MTNASAPPGSYEYEREYVSDKNRLLALLLALLVGCFGIHRFYVGKIGSGIVMVLLDLTIVGFAVTGVWAMVDALFIAFGEFTDANGDKVLDWNL
jgi:TM2 domain-containing membrane protein YozV